MKSFSKFLLPVFIVFIVLLLGIFIFKDQLQAKGFDVSMLLIANAFLLLLQLISFALQGRALKNKNPNVFVRAVMGGMMIKMFTSVIVVLVYALASGGKFNKRTLFVCMILYLVYLGAEVMAISKLNKQKNA